MVFPLHLGGVEVGAGWRHRQLANRTSVNVWLIGEQQIRCKSRGGQAPDEIKTSLGQKTQSANLQIGINNFEKQSCNFYFTVCRTKQELFVGLVCLRIKWHKTQCKYDQKIGLFGMVCFDENLTLAFTNSKKERKKNRIRFLCKQLEQTRRDELPHTNNQLCNTSHQRRIIAGLVYLHMIMTARSL